MERSTLNIGLVRPADATRTCARVKLRRHLNVPNQLRHLCALRRAAFGFATSRRRAPLRRARLVGLLVVIVSLSSLSLGIGRARARPPDPGGAADGDDETTLGPRARVRRPDARVAGVAVELVVWRGGERDSSGDRIARRRALVEGRATYELRAPARAGQRLVLLDYAEVLREEPSDLDEIQIAGYVTGINERARTTITAVTIDGQPGAVRRQGLRRDIVIELPVGASEVELDYRVEVPHRYWPMGCVWRRCSLSGGVAPLPSEPAEGGVWLPSGGRVVSAVPWRVASARFGGVPSWEPGTTPSAAEAKALAGHELIVTQEALDPRAPIAYPSVFWGPRWRRVETWHRGVRIRVLHIDPRPGDHYPKEFVLHPLHDVAGHVLSIVEDALDAAAVVGIEAPPDSALTVVQGPLRSEVSMSHPSAVMISDHYLELFATKRLAKFHDLRVARSVCELISYAHFAGRHDPSTELWVSGAFGVALAQLWQRGRELRDEYAGDLLAAFTFIPSIDSFLYTGQASFSSAYFRGSEDEWPVRHHPLFFANALPSGRRIHEKLSDILTEAEIAEFYRGLGHNPDSDPQRYAEQIWGRELDWFFDQWLGPYPEVDYAITKVAKTRREGGGWRYEITVLRDGELPLVEPVQLYVVERGGARHYLVWNGEAAPGADLLDQPSRAEHVFVVETERRVSSVRLDPRARLVETSRIPTSAGNRGDNNDPLFNNRVPKQGRFVYAGFHLAFEASEFATAQTTQAKLSAVDAGFSFIASARRDVGRSARFGMFTSRETVVGGDARFYVSLGPKRNRQYRRWTLAFGTSVSWLLAGGLDQAGGLRMVESAQLSHNTTKFSFWPERGHRVYGALAAAQTIRTDGAPDHRFILQLDGGWRQFWPLARNHVLATAIDAAMVIPIASELEFRSLQRGGGEAGLIGFTGNELFGRAIARGLIEYRHMIIDDLRLPLFNLVHVRAFTGALFGGVASLSSCDDYSGWFGRNSWYGQVGYGLGSRFEWFGVSPQLIRMNVAVPIGRRTGVRCLGETLPDYLGEVQGVEDYAPLLPPLTINFTYSHLF